MILFLNACKSSTEKEKANDDFNYILEQFADLRILRYQIPGFEELSTKQKEMIYYLNEAAKCGRDILFDQNGAYNLAIRRTLENIYATYKGDRTADEFQKFMVYLKRVWFSNGIYHHYGWDKFIPEFDEDYFRELVSNSDAEGFPIREDSDIDGLMAEITPVIFNPDILSKKVSQDSKNDLIKSSAVNFYENVDQNEVEQFYQSMKVEGDTTPVSYGLNSKLVKENGEIKEQVYSANGLYGPAIKQIIYWLTKAMNVAENEHQKETIKKLVAFYETGDLKIFDEYSINWVKDTESHIDFVNGFIETYNDPLGMKATWESIVNFKNIEATKRTEIISANAQWFEDHSPVKKEFKKSKVKGVSAKVITVTQLGGDCYPSTPIGINLPNADWIRKEFGSKSVTIENITEAYDKASHGNGFLEEFSATQEEVDLIKKYGSISDNLHTDLHECLGHGSGQILSGVSSEALKNYSSTIEEARADLFALYYMMDPKMTELGLLPTLDAAKSQYADYIRNGLLTQLVRIEPGKNIEESHMRNRQLVANWCFQMGSTENVIEKITKEGKTFYKVNDYEKLHELFGKLLSEVQRIKSEGDYNSAMNLVENYGVLVDPQLHVEVLERYKKLNLSPYSGFVNPDLKPILENNQIVDVTINYVNDFSEQMIELSKNYSFLPTYN